MDHIPIELWQTIFNLTKPLERDKLQALNKGFKTKLTKKAITIISYNTLAQRYVTPYIETRYKHVDNMAILEWSYRLPLIFQQINNYDIICLQEVELATINDILLLFPDYAYGYHVINKKRNCPIGNVTMWKKQLFVCDNIELTSCAVFTTLIYIKTAYKFTIANIHLKAGLKSGEPDRVNQMKSIVKRFEKINTGFICGDYNDILYEGSPVKALLNRFTILPGDMSCMVCDGEHNPNYFLFDQICSTNMQLKVWPCPDPVYIPTKDHPSDHYPRIFEILL